MKLRKNDLIELKKGGLIAVTAKLAELGKAKIDLSSRQLKKELKNAREAKILRRSLAQLHTIALELKETL